MGKMLGLGKVESYWLVKKNYFKTIQVPLTAMTEPLEITLSLPFLLEPLLEVFLLPFTARILAGMESQ